MEKDICEMLKEVKAKTGWSETDLAQEIGVTQPTVSRILNGQKDCKGSTFIAIAKLHKAVSSRHRSRRRPPKEPK
jgi:transcriptional regulator with XRE-family HTH domain